MFVGQVGRACNVQLQSPCMHVLAVFMYEDVHYPVPLPHTAVPIESQRGG